MRITDIIPVGKWHEVVHDSKPTEDIQKKEERVRLVTDSYAAGVAECLLSHGSFINNPKLEFQVTMVLLCIFDQALELASNRKVN